MLKGANMVVESEVIEHSKSVVAATEQASGSQAWREYFERNAANLLNIPWNIGTELTEEEIKKVADSVRIFQLGESSEGRHLAQCAKQYSVRTGDHDYYQAIRLFIKEEQRHARELGRFLELHNISLLRKSFSDAVFRQLRKPAGLEVSVAVLVTAEIIAQVYYPALHDSTESRILKQICRQIIQDETPHVQFQCERLAILRRNHSLLRRAVTLAAHRFLMFGTLIVVWSQHHSVFRSGDYAFRKYWTEIRRTYRAAEQIMRHKPDVSRQPCRNTNQ